MKLKTRLALFAVVVLVLAMSVIPALAAGNRPISLVYTASSGGMPQGAFINGQYVRLSTPDCPNPMRILVDDEYVYVCPPAGKLPPLPRP